MLIKMLLSSTYGNRRNGNIEARLSKDDGKKWDVPLRLFQTSGDMGYPILLNFPMAEWSLCFTWSNSAFTMATTWRIGWQAPQGKN